MYIINVHIITYAMYTYIGISHSITIHFES